MRGSEIGTDFQQRINFFYKGGQALVKTDKKPSAETNIINDIKGAIQGTTNPMGA